MKTGSRKAAFTLLILAPVIAESAYSTPIMFAWLVLLWLPVYGGGVLLIRELVARSGRGWPSIVILGLAYELVEDGIGLQALSSPHLYHAAEWGARVLGINLPYWEVNAIYHVTFSAAVPIALTNVLFPAHRNRPYLKRTGLVITAVVAVLGVGILRVTVPPSQDPGYTAPLAVVIGCLIVVAALGVVALKLVPRRSERPRMSLRVPGPWALAVLAFAAVVVVLGMLYPLWQWGATQPSFTRGAWIIVPMALAAALAVGTFALIRRWSASVAWTDTHVVGLGGGAMVAHSLIGTVVAASTTQDRTALAIIALVTAALSVLLTRRISRRSPAADTTGHLAPTGAART
ncbi:hypothetical protein [Microbispora bryophytorum]|uniref:hypothetical protein n=1 Tax=Microbispora bryophytorum TaxID=1460882 RepID=UPI003712DA69